MTVYRIIAKMKNINYSKRFSACLLLRKWIKIKFGKIHLFILIYITLDIKNRNNPILNLKGHIASPKLLSQEFGFTAYIVSNLSIVYHCAI